jgi:hypothetical protein
MPLFLIVLALSILLALTPVIVTIGAVIVLIIMGLRE